MEWRQFISAYRVVHRLPGRIRIHIPMLAILPPDWRKYVKPAAELIGMKDGITAAEIQPITGNVLIGYDPDKIDEACILRWLETLVADFMNLDVPSKPLNENNILNRFEQLRNRLCQEGVP